MTVLLVDWLGRGGIAHTSEAWYAELSASGHEVVVVTRPDRELMALAGDGSYPVATRPGKVRAHRAVVDAAAAAIAELRPSTVVIQNYVLPALEWKVYRAAARAGARLVLVVHDHRLHSRLAGNHAGLRRCLRAADAVVTHSQFVAGAVRDATGRSDIVVTPLPVPVGILRQLQPSGVPRGRGDDVRSGRSLALHFGALQRNYKGTSTVVELARAGVDGWEFLLMGNGAPPAVDGAEVVPGFIDAGTLVTAVSRSQATLLPYSHASQSGAVTLAQALGSVVIASAVGGVPEQIESGVTGLLLPAGAPVASWDDALRQLRDEVRRSAMAAAARQGVWQNHDLFTHDIQKLAA